VAAPTGLCVRGVRDPQLQEPAGESPGVALTPSAMVALGTPAPDFSLPDTDERLVSGRDFAGRPMLVMFLCNHCPYVKHVANDLAQIAHKYAEKGMAVVGINSNDPVNYPEDSPDMMRREKRSRGYSFPYLFDETQAVARAFNAQCTPDFFLYDANHRLAYRGQFDDSRPGNGKPITGIDLTQAVDAVLAGRPVAGEQKPSMGCNVKWRPMAAHAAK
jgi:peroxiredoxin